MDTLHDRLAELAEDAPTGGAPAAELWARGKRAHRLRVGALAAALTVVGVVGTGIGVRLADGGDERSDIAPAGIAGMALPIEYPVGQALPDLGDKPGPLAAIWFVPRGGGGAPEVVGLVAETGEFGTLPIDVSRDYVRGKHFALSPDGRRIAYQTSDPSAGEPMVHDLESGESYAPAFEDFGPDFEPTEGYTWVDSTHLVGHADMDADGWLNDAEGWAWEPGTAPKEVDVIAYVGSPYLVENAGREPWFLTSDDPRKCLSLRDLPGGKQIPVLCDVVGRLGSEFALTHDGDGAVIALDIRGVEDESLRHVVATPDAPRHGAFATDLIAHALGLAGGAS
ncbi:hypothetical protein EKO23_19150 [Nocardioides guangzhouensis]|uniref:WD40 repeat domain-containing protein n=1 Tax=Nocardioides guangzhouensis TaxID=2497878 RepID=A0A4Q4Z7N5_9ACTN|nr:hypothetical protein [Nocardioides guangzhouensis]RYP83415.1 hypothetical protein EKO23_19150 [Nocardioides guangzhouensis]